MKKKVVVNDRFQKNYVYYRTEPAGRNFDSEFKPELTPRQMLKMGVFGGVYFNDKPKEFPASWFKGVKFSEKKDPDLNFFRISASQSISVWRNKGWIRDQDPRGWVQWYFRYYIGRRSKDDERQIKRWKAFRRHLSQVKKNCHKGDFSCRRRQRQALLHWAYDSRKI